MITTQPAGETSTSADATDADATPAAPAPSSKKRKRTKDGSGSSRPSTSEYGVSRGVDFVDVACVINFDLPFSSRSYTHRVGRTARAGRTGTSLSFVVPRELWGKQKKNDVSLETARYDDKVWARIDKAQRAKGQEVKEYRFDLKQVEGFRYRMEDGLRSVTKAAVREARIKEIKNEVLNSEKLKVRALLSLPSRSSLRRLTDAPVCARPCRPTLRTTPATSPSSGTTRRCTPRASSPTSSTSQVTSCPASQPSAQTTRPSLLRRRRRVQERARARREWLAMCRSTSLGGAARVADGEEGGEARGEVDAEEPAVRAGAARGRTRSREGRSSLVGARSERRGGCAWIGRGAGTDSVVMAGPPMSELLLESRDRECRTRSSLVPGAALGCSLLPGPSRLRERQHDSSRHTRIRWRAPYDRHERLTPGPLRSRALARLRRDPLSAQAASSSELRVSRV